MVKQTNFKKTKLSKKALSSSQTKQKNKQNKFIAKKKQKKNSKQFCNRANTVFYVIFLFTKNFEVSRFAVKSIKIARQSKQFLILHVRFLFF